jgi:hypothetical protein
MEGGGLGEKTAMTNSKGLGETRAGSGGSGPLEVNRKLEEGLGETINQKV